VICRLMHRKLLTRLVRIKVMLLRWRCGMSLIDCCCFQLFVFHCWAEEASFLLVGVESSVVNYVMCTIYVCSTAAKMYCKYVRRQC